MSTGGNAEAARGQHSHVWPHVGAVAHHRSPRGPAQIRKETGQPVMGDQIRLQRIADPPPAGLTVRGAGSPALPPCEMTRANPDEQVQLPLPPRWPEPHAEHCSEHSYPPTCRSMQARGRSGGQPGSCTTSPSTPASTMDGEETQVRMQREEEDATGAAWSRHWSPPPLPAGCSGGGPRGTAGGDLRAAGWGAPRVAPQRSAEGRACLDT